MIDRPDAYNSVILIQSRLADPASQALRRQLAECLESGKDSALVFFHAAAAALDDDRERGAWKRLADSYSVTLAVCHAARARRVAAVLDPAFKDSSLIAFWDAVLRADSLYAPRHCAVRCGRFLIRIAHQHDELEAREYLELVLAGASLELDLIVLFESDGLALLAGGRARPWRQLIEHGLARMVTTDVRTESTLPEVVDASTIEQWRTSRCWIEP